MSKSKSSACATLWSTLYRYIRPNMFRNTWGILALLLHSYLAVQIPAYVKAIINGLQAGFSRAELVHSCLWMLTLSASAGFSLFFARWAIIGASRAFELKLRNVFFAHIQTLTPRFYHENKTGDLMTRFASDIEQVRMLVGPGIMYPGQTVLITVMALYSMFTLDYKLTVTLLIPIILLLIYVNINTRLLHRVYREAQDIYSELTAKVQENFSGIRVIKAYCQEEAEYQRVREINDRYLDRNIAQTKLRGKLFPFMQFIGGVGLVLILWLGGTKVIRGSLRLGDLVQFSIYYQMLMWPIIALGWIINVIHRGVASWRRIAAVLHTEPEILTPGELPALENSSIFLPNEISVRNLTFSYNENTPPVLENISFHVQPGHTLAIVGPTGSGKTTLVNLLLHLYTVPRGCIFFSGIDINDIPLDTLRQSIAYVSQEVFLFSDTIRSNILFGFTDSQLITETALVDAARRAQLHTEIAEFPQQYDTEIGERGITLSGGQKQRTGIARALILNRPILILDDCLSSVDTSTEEAILRGLAESIDKSTAIIISHRISTVKNADHILVLDHGRIVEAGDHNFLIAQDGLYARIYRRQLLEESLGIRV